MFALHANTPTDKTTILIEYLESLQLIFNLKIERW